MCNSDRTVTTCQNVVTLGVFCKFFVCFPWSVFLCFFLHFFLFIFFRVSWYELHNK